LISKEFYGQTISCECGKPHAIQPRRVVYETGAVERLPTVCAGAVDGRRVAVFMDARTRDVAGLSVMDALRSEGWAVQEIMVSDPSPGKSPVCDDITRDAVASGVGEVDLIVPVGSGVINDLGKWVADDRDLPFVCFATAASMNGYASANVAPTVKGVKTLIRARPPIAVVSDPAIIESAPWKLTASGLGDILAKAVSSTDWRLNHLLFGDYYCTRSVGLIGELEPLYLDHPDALLARDPDAVGALFQGLLLTGVAMTMAETSAPSSGGEHMISHSLDMLSTVDGVGHDLHGRQVGVGTILASELYRRVLALESPEWQTPTLETDRPFWGSLADVVAEHYGTKVDRLHTAREQLSQGDTWDRLRSALSEMIRPPERTRDCLAAAGAACCAADIGCSRDRLLAVLTHGHEIRGRFTILDLARLAGVMPGAAEEIVETWA
jgi:glycerol-1-phosphate dehydrogenase [NAD(P)+]